MEAGAGRKIRLLHAQLEPTILGRGFGSAVRIERPPDQFPSVRRRGDPRPKYQMSQAQHLGKEYYRVRATAGFYASSPLARCIIDLKSLPTADQSPLMPSLGYRGVSVCAGPTSVAAPNPRMRPEKNPPDAERRPTTPPLRLCLRYSALDTVGSSILASRLECTPWRRRARCSCRARYITFRSRMHSRSRRSAHIESILGGKRSSATRGQFSDSYPNQQRARLAPGFPRVGPGHRRDAKPPYPCGLLLGRAPPDRDRPTSLMQTCLSGVFLRVILLPRSILG
jgi:hypothetical protein